MAGCIVAKHINDISLNGLEFLLEGDAETEGTVMVFNNKQQAVEFLEKHGFIEEDIYYMRFLDADAYNEGTETEV